MAIDAVLNGTTITASTLEGSVTDRLSKPRIGTIRVPTDQVTISPTDRLKVVVDGTLDFHGMCTDFEVQGDEDTIYTVANFADPRILWDYRPARAGPDSADPGDFSKPDLFRDPSVTGPQILEQVLLQSADGSDQALGEGALFLDMGTFATAGVDLSGAITDFPVMISELVGLLTDTGEVDVEVVPTDPGGGVMGTVNVYNGDMGTDRSGTVALEYATGSFNARACRMEVDLHELVNKYWIYGGPRVGTSADPAGDQHWRFNITADDSGLADPPLSDILTARSASQSAYGVRMLIDIFDGDGVIVERELFRWLWLLKSWLAQQPKKLVHITPQRGMSPLTFFVGDLITVSAGAKFNGGFSGVQRVMEKTYRWDQDGVAELGEPVGQSGSAAVTAGSAAVVTTDIAELPT